MLVDYPPVFIINLPDCKERRDYMLAQCEQLGVSPDFFPAVDGRKEHPLFGLADYRRREKLKGKPFSPGELGCWASHYQLWERCIELNQPIVVLEDDARLDERFPDLLRVLPILAEKVPYARLYVGNTPKQKLFSLAGFDIYRHKTTPFGTVGYLLTPAAAKQFLACARDWVLAVDDYMDLTWKHGVRRLAISPPLVALDQDFGSLVQPPSKPQLSLWGKCQREAFRFYLWLRLRG